jgi:ankyrin repeat protein
VADYLLTNNVHKADIDTVNLAGETCLWFAVVRSNRRFTKLFLDSLHAVNTLAAPYGPNQWSILMRALFELDESGDEVVKILAEAMVAKGVGLNHRASGSTKEKPMLSCALFKSCTL